MSARDFLIGRTKETVQVPILGLGGSKSIEIRARLSKREYKQHQYILDKWRTCQESNTDFIETDEDEKQLAKLLEFITIDPSLTAEFWLSDEIAPEIADDILIAYFIDEPAQRMAAIQKFLAKRLWAGLRSNATNMDLNPWRIRST